MYTRETRARQRLPTEMVIALTRETGNLLCDQADTGWRWRGRTVKLIDGTGISMLDTPDNQEQYPQSSNQPPGVGFPLARLVAIICLSTGAVGDAAMGPFQGKGRDEHALLRKIQGALCPGDVVLADALYCSYWLIATLQADGIDGYSSNMAVALLIFAAVVDSGPETTSCPGRNQHVHIGRDPRSTQRARTNSSCERLKQTAESW